MRRYETVFVLRPDLGDSAQKEIIRRFEGIVSASSGEMIETEEWGFRELAYNIKGEHRGFYVRLDYGGNGGTMNEVERNLKLSDSVLRYLSVSVDRDIEPARARAELEARRRRTVEARAAVEASRAPAEAARAAAGPSSAEPPESEVTVKESAAGADLQGEPSTEPGSPKSEPSGQQSEGN